MTEAYPLLFRYEGCEIEFNFVGVGVLRQSESLREAHDMGVNTDGLLPEGVAEDDVRGFSADAGKSQEVVDPVRHLAAEALHQFLTAILNRFGFVAVEIYLANLLLKSRQGRLSVVVGFAISLEKSDGDLPNQVIPGLGRQDERDKEFERIGEIEIELGVGVGLFQPLDDLLDASLSRSGPRVGLLRGSHFGFIGKYVTRRSVAKGGIFEMDLKELQRMTTPKLRDLAKESTDLQGVAGMHKEDLIKAIAKAQGIAYDESAKDINAIHAVKQDIRALQKQKAELVTSNGDRKDLKRIRRKVKLLKRLTRHLAHETKVAAAAKAAAPAAPTPPAAPAAPQATG
jgi:Rho termination factor, N-terminal domain